MSPGQHGYGSWWPLVLLFLIAYGAFLMAHWPAAHAYHLLEPRLPPELGLERPEGTLWHGTAAQLRVGDVRLENLTWRIAPLSLARGAVELEWSLEGPHDRGEGRITVAPAGITLTETHFQLEMGTVEQWAGDIPVALGGYIAGELAHLQWNRDGELDSVAGRGRWQEARMLAPAAAELGAFDANLGTEGDALLAEFRHQEGGPLGVEGTIRLTRNAEYRIDGRVWADETADPAVHEALRALGHQQPGEAAPLQLSGRL